MKRYVCIVVTGLLLALVSTGTATATGLPTLGQSPTQVTTFGDQTVGEQKNDADVNHEQNNVNVLSPPIAIAVLGNAEAGNDQKNVDASETNIKQGNEAEQNQSFDPAARQQRLLRRPEPGRRAEDVRWRPDGRRAEERRRRQPRAEQRQRPQSADRDRSARQR